MGRSSISINPVGTAIRIIGLAVVPLLLIAIWELAVRAEWLPSSITASPTRVVSSAETLIKNGDLLRHAIASLMRLVLGFCVGTVLALVAGILVGYSRLAERLFRPTLSLLSPIPVTAWIPMIIVFAGVGELAKTAVVAIGTFFPVYFGTVNGIRGADPRLVEIARLYEKGPFTTLKYVLLPSALDSIFLGMRSALGLAWVLLVVAEVIASSNGLGWLMWDARNFARPADVVVGMVATGVLGASSMAVLSEVQRRVLFWKLSFGGVE